MKIKIDDAAIVQILTDSIGEALMSSPRVRRNLIERLQLAVAEPPINSLLIMQSEGDDGLRKRLQKLSVSQLRRIASVERIDYQHPSSKAQLIQLIVNAAKQRVSAYA